MKHRDSYNDPYVVKQINSLPTNTNGGYADILIDNTEIDIIIIWSDNQIDPQVIHVMRDKVDELIRVLQHCKQGRDKFLAQ